MTLFFDDIGGVLSQQPFIIFLVDGNFIEEQVSLLACTRMPFRKYRSILSDNLYVTCLGLVEVYRITFQYIVLAAFFQCRYSFRSKLAVCLSVFGTIYFQSGQTEDIVTRNQIGTQ